MALDPREIIAASPAEDEFLPPAPLAGTRRQRMQRLQVGLFGVGTMVLLVGLANIIMTSAEANRADAVTKQVPTASVDGVSERAPRDPLADAGVVPELPVEPVPGATGGSASPTPLARVPGDVPPPQN